jgi:hypothetical protein
VENNEFGLDGPLLKRILMKKLFLNIMIIALIALSAIAQIAPLTYEIGNTVSLDSPQPPVPRLESSVVIDILPTDISTKLWLGTGKGVTRLVIDTLSSVPVYQFDTYSVEQGLGRGGVSGILWTDSIIWASFAFDSATTVGNLSAGGGLAYSRDQGATWTWFDQPRDRVYELDGSGRDLHLGYWPTTTPVQNITYDIALSDSFVWIASFAGGLRKHAFAADYTQYNDSTAWRLVTPDTLTFHPAAPDRLNHRIFSVLYAEGALWVGTAGGVDKSTDNGRTWTNYNAVNTSGGLSGNFVTALSYQPETHTIWAASWRAEGLNETYAVSKTTNGGNTWTHTLTEDQIETATGVRNSARAHNFGFDGTTVYVCDDIGLWKSVNGGTSWFLFPRMVDSDVSSGGQFYSDAIYAALKASGRLWVGGSDGMALSLNDGLDWRLFQAATPLNDPSRPVETYAYPCPWSPERHGPVKIRFNTTGGSVKIIIYDFAMSKVVELPFSNRAPGEQYLVWDGTKDGKVVANGTYFYKVEKPGGEVWGKLIVLD